MRAKIKRRKVREEKETSESGWVNAAVSANIGKPSCTRHAAPTAWYITFEDQQLLTHFCRGTDLLTELLHLCNFLCTWIQINAWNQAEEERVYYPMVLGDIQCSQFISDQISDRNINNWLNVDEGWCSIYIWKSIISFLIASDWLWGFKACCGVWKIKCREGRCL